MKTRNLRRLLASLLCLCMVAGLLPAAGFAAELPAADPPDGNGFSDPVYQVEADTEPVLDTEPDDGTGPDANTDPFLTTNSASVSLLAANVSNNGPYQGDDATTANHNTHIYVVEGKNTVYYPYTTYSGYTTSAPAGMSYDLSTNTLTLNNYNGAGYWIETNMMGSDFTVELIGTNVLDGMDLYGYAWGCGLTFTGSGTLTVNESRGRSYGLALYGEGAEPTLHVSRESTVTVYSAAEGHPIFLEGSSSLSTSPITYDGQLSGGTPAAKRPNMVVNDIPTENGSTGNCVIYTEKGNLSGAYYGFTTVYNSNPSTSELLSITYRLWALTGDPAGGFTYAEKVLDENGEQVSYVSYIENEAPTEVAAAYIPVQEALANWSISADGDFLHPAQRVVFSPSGTVGGEQGISAVNAFFSTFKYQGNPSIRGGLPYSLFLYTAQPVTGTENATATVHYKPADGEPQSLTVSLTGTAGSYLLSGGGEALDSDVTGTIDKVVFAMGKETREVSVNLPIVATVRVRFTGAVSAKVAKYLEVYQGDNLLETVSLGWDPTPQDTYVTWASADGRYALQVTGTQYGREVVYARGSISGLETTLALEDVTLTKVSPRVVATNGEALERCTRMAPA